MHPCPESSMPPEALYRASFRGKRPAPIEKAAKTADPVQACHALSSSNSQSCQPSTAYVSSLSIFCFGSLLGCLRVFACCQQPQALNRSYYLLLLLLLPPPFLSGGSTKPLKRRVEGFWGWGRAETRIDWDIEDFLMFCSRCKGCGISAQRPYALKPLSPFYPRRRNLGEEVWFKEDLPSSSQADSAEFRPAKGCGTWVLRVPVVHCLRRGALKGLSRLVEFFLQARDPCSVGSICSQLS